MLRKMEEHVQQQHEDIFKILPLIWVMIESLKIPKRSQNKTIYNE